MAFYSDALEGAGWTLASPVHRSDGPGRADWVLGDRRLELSAIEIPATQDDPPTDAVQYSLTLRPR